MSRTIMIMAGGTGGHIFPALAVADHLRAQDWTVIWLGSRKGMEARIVAERGYAMAWIRFSGLRGKGVLSALLLPLNLLVAFWQSAHAIFRHRPDVVLGMGGYVAFPGAMMASLFNRPLVIHEQNSIAGLTNRVLARLANRVLAAFPGVFDSRIAVIVTGNPVRAGISDMAAPEVRCAGRAGPLNVLVIGGSLGAQALNETVPRALALIPPLSRPAVTHQSGRAHAAALQANYAAAGVSATLVPFIDDMVAAYGAADLVICRAGATTIAELAAAGIASILVPFPHAVDDHQTANARFLADRDAAVLIPQPEFTAEKLAATLVALTRERIVVMARAARAAGKPGATRAVAEICMALAT